MIRQQHARHFPVSMTRMDTMGQHLPVSTDSEQKATLFYHPLGNYINHIFVKEADRLRDYLDFEVQRRDASYLSLDHSHKVWITTGPPEISSKDSRLFRS
jgi:hypothetical protein